MSHFEEFCKSTPKNEHGYVPDLIDIEFDFIRDYATVAYLRDIGNHDAADNYYFFSDELKNEYYSAVEILMQDEVDKFNDKVDQERAAQQEPESYIDEDYKFQHFNQAMFDAGHKPGDFC